MTRPLPTARQWDDAHTFARARQHAAEQYERNVTVPTQLPEHGPSRDTLLRGLRLAAQFTADVWEQYADDAHTFFLDAERDENAQQLRRSRYDEAASESRPRPLPNTVGPVDVAESFLTGGAA